MSEISEHVKSKSRKIYELTKGFLEGESGGLLYKRYQNVIETAGPLEVMIAFDSIMKDGYQVEPVKKTVNKVLNLLYKALNERKSLTPAPGSWLDSLVRNNEIMADKLEAIKPMVKAFNKSPGDVELRKKLTGSFRELLAFRKHYVIKENLLFPVIEKHLPEYRCLQIMWSFHDEIYSDLNDLVKKLSDEKIDVYDINYLFGAVFFNMLAIKFREEKILFPVVLEHIPQNEFEGLFEESLELGYPFYTPENKAAKTSEKEHVHGLIDLGTGKVTVEQIKLIFSHLPVDITYVDENDTVVFFSTPPDRIFPRTKAVIGRTVQNCHPHESIDVVNRIVESFRKGEKDVAEFWFNMGPKFIFIQYFAVRNENGEYKGVLEVSRDVKHIRELQGVQKLLDW
jgi:PAS domain S-box-containing protein